MGGGVWMEDIEGSDNFGGRLVREARFADGTPCFTKIAGSRQFLCSDVWFVFVGRAVTARRL